MLMSEFGVRLSEMLAIAVEVCVIFADSLMGATIQDGGKRERGGPDVHSHYKSTWTVSKP